MWAEFLQWTLPIAASCAITTIIGFLIKRQLTKYFESVDEERAGREADAQRLKELEDREKEKQLECTITNALQPLVKKIDDIDTKLGLDKRATVTLLRSKMKTLRDQYKKQHYADTGDKATWEELYVDYADMGGNHFKEWVDRWKVEIENLPEEPPKPVTRKKSTSKK